MKERINYIVDKFTDFNGIEHNFVICALSQELPTKAIEMENFNPFIYNAESPIAYYISRYNINKIGAEDIDTIGYVYKQLSLGVSICSPEDKFDIEIGKKIALERARNSDPCMFVSNKGLINNDTVEAILKREALYLKNNPGNYITGYDKAKAQYNETKEMNELKESFDNSEQMVFKELKKNPHKFEKVFKFFNWWKKFINE